MLLFSEAVDQQGALAWADHPGTAYAATWIFYAVLLVLIYFQKLCHWSKERSVFICNLEILLFFFIEYFALGSQRYILQETVPFGQTALMISSLMMYFGALFVCHFSTSTSLENSLKSIRFIAPLSLPFVFFVFLGELDLFSLESEALAALNLTAIIAVFILFPPLLILLWGCPKLTSSPLTDELEALCDRLKFNYSSFRVWNVIHGSATAAVVGILGFFRYVLFTQELLSLFPPQAIKAVLAHEIGHVHHRHLLIYPFILLGMLFLGYGTVIFLYDPLFGQTGILAYTFIVSSDLIRFLVPLALFLILALSAALYFRFVFGYFSRLFERQADLYIFSAKIEADDLILALDMLGRISGNIHDLPNWHHYSIRERMDFLEAAAKNRRLIDKHHRHVRCSLIAYGCILLLFFAYFGCCCIYRT